jgi:hypothetical protein
MGDISQLVQKIGGSLSEDGRIGELRFFRADKSAAYIQFRMEEAASLLLNVERAIGVLFEGRFAALEHVPPELTR